MTRRSIEGQEHETANVVQEEVGKANDCSDSWKLYPLV